MMWQMKAETLNSVENFYRIELDNNNSEECVRMLSSKSR